QTMSNDANVDYLRSSLADEIANVLNYSRTLDVRPSSITRKYVAPDLDPQKVGQELHVSRILTGHYLRQAGKLLVTLEAIDVATDGLLWQDTFSASVKDVI